jgi:hypothetical protein
MGVSPMGVRSVVRRSTTPPARGPQPSTIPTPALLHRGRTFAFWEPLNVLPIDGQGHCSYGDGHERPGGVGHPGGGYRRMKAQERRRASSGRHYGGGA